MNSQASLGGHGASREFRAAARLGISEGGQAVRSSKSSSIIVVASLEILRPWPHIDAGDTNPPNSVRVRSAGACVGTPLPSLPIR
jgi:hypothetical protein